MTEKHLDPEGFARTKALVEDAMDIFEDMPDGAFWAAVAEYAGLDPCEGAAALIPYLEND